MKQAILKSFYSKAWIFLTVSVLLLILSRTLKTMLPLQVKLFLRSARVNICVGTEYHIRRENSSLINVNIHGSCNFLQRIDVFNDVLQQFRAEQIKAAENTDWKSIAPDKDIRALGSVNENFFNELDHFPYVKTIFLSWSPPKTSVWTSLEDNSNVLIKNYFDWTGDDELCKLIETADRHTPSYVAAYNKTCIRNIERTRQPKSLGFLMLHITPLDITRYWPNNGKSYPSHFYCDTPRYMFYIHLIRNGIVNADSNVWTGKVKIVPMTCGYDLSTTPPGNVNQTPLHDEVMAISQTWGLARFHRMVEVIPRISPYIKFLKANLQIKILVPEQQGRTAELLNVLGITNDRLITGSFRAKHVYLPRGTMCGVPNVQEIQLLSMLYHDYTRKHFPTEQRDKIVLIRRSASRRFLEQLEIEKMIEGVAMSFKLKFVMYIDNPSPSLNETMKMFYSAVMVVAPHGAGLANIIFSQPGTSVVEGLCHVPATNVCYQMLADSLGHRWHGIASTTGCPHYVNVSASSVKDAMLRYLKLLNLK